MSAVFAVYLRPNSTHLQQFSAASALSTSGERAILPVGMCQSPEAQPHVPFHMPNEWLNRVVDIVRRIRFAPRRRKRKRLDPAEHSPQGSALGAGDIKINILGH